MHCEWYECFEQLNIMDDMNDWGSCELKPLDAMSSLGLWMILMTSYHELMVVDNMNNSRSWAYNSRYYEHLKIVVDMKEFGL